MTDSNPKILIVDDRPENLVALERTLSDLKVDFVRVNSGNAARKCAKYRKTGLRDVASGTVGRFLC